MMFARLAVAVAIGVLTAHASAAPVTSTAGFGTASVIDFSQFAASCGSFAAAGCQGPLNVGSLVGETVTYTGTSGTDGSSVYNNTFGLGGNGVWGDGRNGFVGNNDVTAFMQFMFEAGPVAGVGGFVNYAPSFFGEAIMEALDSQGNVIETFNVTADAPISTPGAENAGAFRGFLHATSDIYGVRYSNAFSGLDDRTFTRGAAIPEPSMLALVALALGALSVARRRKTEGK